MILGIIQKYYHYHLIADQLTITDGFTHLIVFHRGQLKLQTHINNLQHQREFDWQVQG